MIARAVVVAAVVLSFAGVARGERIVGVLDVRGDGVSDVVIARFGEAIEDGLEGASAITPAPQVRMREQLASTAWSPSCLVGACLAEVKAQTDAAWVVTAGLTGAGESYRYTITLLDTATGRVLQQISETCAACTVDDVASQATLATMGLIDAGDPGAGGGPVEPRRPIGRGDHHARTLRRARKTRTATAATGHSGLGPRISDLSTEHSALNARAPAAPPGALPRIGAGSPALRRFPSGSAHRPRGSRPSRQTRLGAPPSPASAGSR